MDTIIQWDISMYSTIYDSITQIFNRRSRRMQASMTATSTFTNNKEDNTTSHSTQQTQGDCISATFLKNEASQHGDHRPQIMTMV
jgi:hypothetical protein